MSQTLRAQVSYLYPLQKFPICIEGKSSYMSYMDIRAANSNAKKFILFRGKSFNAYFWKESIALLMARGCQEALV